MALRLRRYGIIRVRPLEGGLHRWQDLHYPIDRLDQIGEPSVPAIVVGEIQPNSQA